MRPLFLPVVMVLSACDATDPVIPDPDPLDTLAIALEVVATGLASPVFLTSSPGDDRLFVVEQPGRIRIIRKGAVDPTPFLDLTDRVISGGERGLLGLAFHPEFATNGRLYVHYTGAGGHTMVERYLVTDDPDVVAPATASLVLTVTQPFNNHNGGQVSFGPDGYLYVALGDGGSTGDPQGHGQNTATLLGSILRLNVDEGEPYTIPADNPFADGVQGRAEIWAWGLRNPWRFSHDAASGTLFIADVGQNRWEEVNIALAALGGVNYGWNVLEGTECFDTATCDAAGTMLPALVYPHGDGSGRGCSVSGGQVYRGADVPLLHGWYLYADYCSGWIRGLRWTGTTVLEDRELLPPGIGSITSFGRDGRGELYVLTQAGTIYRIVTATDLP